MKNLFGKTSAYRASIGRRKEDVEKAVLPTIIFINPNHPSFEENRMPGFMIIIGWWDFSVRFGWLNKKA